MTKLLTNEDFQTTHEVLLDENGENVGTRAIGPIARLIDEVIGLTKKVTELESRVAKLEKAGKPEKAKAKADTAGV